MINIADFMFDFDISGARHARLEGNFPVSAMPTHFSSRLQINARRYFQKGRFLPSIACMWLLRDWLRWATPLPLMKYHDIQPPRRCG